MRRRGGDPPQDHPGPDERGARPARRWRAAVAAMGAAKSRKVASRIEGFALIVREMGYRLAALRDTVDGEASAVGCGAREGAAS